jgi:hypothetical protein
MIRFHKGERADDGTWHDTVVATVTDPEEIRQLVGSFDPRPTGECPCYPPALSGIEFIKGDRSIGFCCSHHPCMNHGPFYFEPPEALFERIQALREEDRRKSRRQASRGEISIKEEPEREPSADAKTRR